jgi:hypothetical protein
MQLTVNCIHCDETMIISELELAPVVAETVATTTAQLTQDFEAKLAVASATIQSLEQKNKALQLQLDAAVSKVK